MGSIAYLDPGTGSMVVGAIAGIGASVAVAAKAGWHKTLGRKKAAPAQAPESESAASPAASVDAVDELDAPTTQTS